MLPLEIRHKRRLTRSEWFWAVVLCAALTVFMILGQPEAGITQPSGKAWTIPLRPPNPPTKKGAAPGRPLLS